MNSPASCIFSAQLYRSIRKTIVGLVIITTALISVSCGGKEISLLDADDVSLGTIKVQTSDEGSKISFGKELSAAIDAGDALYLAIRIPEESLIVTYASGDGTVLEQESITPPIGMTAGQAILETELLVPPGATAILMPFDAEEIFYLRATGKSQELYVDDFRIVQPHSLRYRQEVMASQSSNSEQAPERISVIQEVMFQGLLNGFDYLNAVPVIEVEYEYTKPDGVMPVDNSGNSFPGQTFATPEPPTGRLDFVGEEAGNSESYELRLSPGVNQVYLYPERFAGTPQAVRFSHNSMFGRLRSVRLISIPRSKVTISAQSMADLEPLPIDLGYLMDYNPALWRNPDFELFSWSLFPDVLIFDFSDYETQSRFLRRLAFFVEKEGYRGTLLSNTELASLHGWNAHNYHPRDLARFFNAAGASSTVLNDEEITLRKLLIARGILVENNGRYEEGVGQIISISSDPTQTRASRDLFLNHEALHGTFYNLPGLQELANQLWADLPEDSREYLKYYFSYVGYDRDDEYLMVNEFQAYMLQQDLVNLRWLIQTRMSERIVRKFPSLQSFVSNTRVDAGWDFLAAGEALQTNVYQETGIRAGDLFSLVPVE